jgi:hypothetical protein
MASSLGFYELLEPYFAFGLAANTPGAALADLRQASADLNRTLPGASSALMRVVTGILDYLSVEELLTSASEEAVVYRGRARFGGEGRANPGLPPAQEVASPGGQVLSWVGEFIDFRLTAPRRGGVPAFDTSGLNAADQADLQQLNDLLLTFADTPAAPISDAAGVDFRLELLVHTVKLTLPTDLFLPARFAPDGSLEVDPNFKAVVFEFPQMAFVLEQTGEAGNLDFRLRSWDSPGFDDPGDVDTARFFSVTPPLFMHASRTCGFGIERLVADFSDDVTPPEVLEQFGVGDDFNGLWLPLVRIIVAPGRTTGTQINAFGKDLLWDFERGLSGELGIEVLRRGGELTVEPFFYRPGARAPLELARGDIERGPDGTTVVSQGAVTIPGAGELHLAVTGSVPPYTVSVRLGGNEISPDTSAGVNRPRWAIAADAEGILSINVTDKPARNRWQETIKVSHLPLPEPVPPRDPAKQYDILFTPGATTGAFEIIHDEDLSEAPNLVLRLKPDQPRGVLKHANQVFERRPDGTYRMVLTPGDAPAQFIATWESSSVTPTVADLQVVANQDRLVVGDQRDLGARLYFKKEYPITPKHEVSDIVGKVFDTPGVRSGLLGLAEGDLNADGNAIITAIDDFLSSTQGPILVSGFASHEKDSGFTQNEALAQKRADVLRGLIARRLADTGASRPFDAAKGFSHKADEANPDADSDPRFRVGIATAAQVTVDGGHQASAELVERPRTPVPEPQVEHPPAPSEPERPPFFRRFGGRLRLERDELSLFELFIQLDFTTQAEETAGFIRSGDSRNEGTSNLAQAVTTAPGASESGEQGVLDARFTITWDRPTRRRTMALALGFDQATRDGWVHIGKFTPRPLANTLGSLLVFAPLLNQGIESAVNREGDESQADIVIAAAEVGLATALGLTGALEFQKWTLFGIELSATQLLSDDEEGSESRFGNLAALLDYAVDFVVAANFGLFTVESALDPQGNPRPTRVRYRGFGFRLEFQDPNTYQPVFDTSRGFELGMAEPGALVVGGPLGPLLRVDSVKVGRQNPLVLEMDLGLNANLGVVEVESVRVRMPIEPPGVPLIIPTAVKVNIPGTLVGEGYLDIRDTGVVGSLDLTLIPLKLRMQAGAGLERLQDGERRLTAFFLGLGVEFASPIPLAQSGLGLYGLLGLFGMHYKRDEEPPSNPNLPVALDWFYNKAKGEPHLLAVDGRRTWVASADRWSFGVGAVLGTLEGATILNLKGMLVLELPGPRVLVFVKAQILKPKPPTGKPAEQTTGILAVVDLNLPAGYIAVGLIVNYEVKNLLRIEVPIDALWSAGEEGDVDLWHLYIGSLTNRASAEVLGITKGTGYLMFDGTGIPLFPLVPLQGFSIAAGIAASMVIGDEDSGLYARVAGSLDMALTRDPLHFFGVMKLEGRIHLWFVSVGASAKLTVEAPEPLYLDGEVCGSVSLLFTSIEGCVGFSLGSPHPLPDPAALLTGLSLLSHSPALAEGQGTDAPVDGSLGVAEHGGAIVENVPLDAIPVLQMRFPPVFGAAATGLKPSSTAPTLPQSGDGWFTLGGVPGKEGEREARYEITGLTISPPLPDPSAVIPVTWWQPARGDVAGDSQATDKGVSLALNSWIPVPFPRAYVRSQEQVRTLRERFEIVCRPVAPPAAVLWTFNAHFTILVSGVVRDPDDPFPGPSAEGWRLDGLQWPDPPDTHRTTAPATELHVHEPDYPGRSDLLLQEYATALTGQVLDPARVIPDAAGVDGGQALQCPFLQFFADMKDPDLDAEIAEVAKQFLDGAKDRERIVVECGDVVEARCLLSTHRRAKASEFMLLRALDAGGGVVEEVALPGRIITDPGQLPASWLDASGPWQPDVRRVVDFFTDEFKEAHVMFLVEYKPAAPIARLELLYRPPDPAAAPLRDPPAVVLGVVETLSRAEAQRAETAQQWSDEMVEVIVNSLEQGDKRPLLAPDTLYTVTVEYRGEIRKSDKPSVKNAGDFTQQFQFRTAAAAPPRLNPWVLAAVPENDNGSHFVDDPVQFVFNDTAAIQLFAAFGKTLRAVLRKANGNHPPQRPAIGLPNLQGVKGTLGSPYAVSMNELVLDLPCVPGTFELEQHQVFTLDILLERGTEYILDIEAEPGDPAATTPLFRTAFTTSRFTSAAELAGLVREGLIGERLLRDALVLPTRTKELVVPDDTAPRFAHTVQVETVTDAEMEAALLGATGSDVPPAHQPGVTLLWSGLGPSRPAAVLVDAPEPLLRTRPVPVEVGTPTPDGDIIQHYRTGEQMYLELVEAGSALAERIVYATGGGRALVFLQPGATGTLRLALRQHRHTLLLDDPAHREFALVELDVPARAVWD